MIIYLVACLQSSLAEAFQLRDPRKRLEGQHFPRMGAKRMVPRKFEVAVFLHFSFATSYGRPCHNLDCDLFCPGKVGAFILCFYVFDIPACNLSGFSKTHKASTRYLIPDSLATWARYCPVYASLYLPPCTYFSSWGCRSADFVLELRQSRRKSLSRNGMMTLSTTGLI